MAHEDYTDPATFDHAPYHGSPEVIEAGDHETYCSQCGEVVALDAESCPTCGTSAFDPVKEY